MRFGLTKDQVKQAKQSLLNRQLYPSVDAVRIELGNTGSKSTIHKYLKELEDETEPHEKPSSNLTDSLQNFVAQLAQQLHLEADERIENIKKIYVDKEKQHEQQKELLEEKYKNLELKLSSLEKQFHQTSIQLAQKENELDQKKLDLELSKQRNDALEQQVAQQQRYYQDVLEKFEHAQRALEHYRESVKEQRQQDLRRHDNAIQHLQNEIRQLQQTIMVERTQKNELKEENVKLSTQAIEYKNAQITQMTQLKSLEKDNQQKDSVIMELKEKIIHLDQNYQQLIQDHQQIENLVQKQETEKHKQQLAMQDIQNKLLATQTELSTQQNLYNELLKILTMNKSTQDHP